MNTSLRSQLEEQKKVSASKRSPEVLAVMKEESLKLINSGIVKQSLKQGNKAIDFSLPNADEKVVTLSELLKKGPVVLVFYRGAWCPYCNLTLRAYQQILPQIRKLGANLVAVSPQTVDKTSLTTVQAELKFEVLSDFGNKVAREYRLVYTLPESLQNLYQSWGNNIAEYNGGNYELPLASTLIIDKNGIIAHAFVTADYTKRMEPKEIIKELQKLTSAAN